MFLGESVVNVTLLSSPEEQEAATLWKPAFGLHAMNRFIHRRISPFASCNELQESMVIQNLESPKNEYHLLPSPKSLGSIEISVLSREIELEAFIKRPATSHLNWPRLKECAGRFETR